MCSACVTKILNFRQFSIFVLAKLLGQVKTYVVAELRLIGEILFYSLLSYWVYMLLESATAEP